MDTEKDKCLRNDLSWISTRCGAVNKEVLNRIKKIITPNKLQANEKIHLFSILDRIADFYPRHDLNIHILKMIIQVLSDCSSFMHGLKPMDVANLWEFVDTYFERVVHRKILSDNFMCTYSDDAILNGRHFLECIMDPTYRVCIVREFLQIMNDIEIAFQNYPAYLPNFRSKIAAAHHFFKHKYVSDLHFEDVELNVTQYYDYIMLLVERSRKNGKLNILPDPSSPILEEDTFRIGEYEYLVKVYLKNQRGFLYVASCYFKKIKGRK